jgi:hypothetical protein
LYQQGQLSGLAALNANINNFITNALQYQTPAQARQSLQNALQSGVLTAGRALNEYDVQRATGKSLNDLFKTAVQGPQVLGPLKALPDLTGSYVPPTAPPPEAPPSALTPGQEGLDPGTAIVGNIPTSAQVRIPQLDAEFRASAPRTPVYDRLGRVSGYEYTPAAKLAPATGTTVFNWTPPGVTSRPRQLLSRQDVPGATFDPVTGEARMPLSASQRFARDRAQLDRDFRQMYAAQAAQDSSLPAQAPASAAQAFRELALSDPETAMQLKLRDIEQQRFDPAKADMAVRARYGAEPAQAAISSLFAPFINRNMATLQGLAKLQNPVTYSQRRPDVAEAYAKMSPEDKKKFPTLLDYEVYHYNTFGKNEDPTLPNPLEQLGKLQSPYSTAFFSKGGEASTEDFIKKQSGGDVSRGTSPPNTAEVPSVDAEGRLIDEREEIRSESQRMLNRLQSQPSKLPPGLRRTIAATKAQGTESMFPAAAPARDLLSGIIGASPTAPGSEAYRTGQALANMPPVQAAAAIPAKIAASAGDAATALAAMGPAVGAVMKPKGGNWVMNQPGKYLRTLKNAPDVDQDIVMAQERLAGLENTPSPFNTEPMRRELKQELAGYETEKSLNNWIDTKLGKYIKNEMGTPEDPLRKLAERGVLHISAPRLQIDDFHNATFSKERQDMLNIKRSFQGFPEEGFATGDLAKYWEGLADEALNIDKQKDYLEDLKMSGRPENSETSSLLALGNRILKTRSEKMLENNPWLKELDPETPLYSLRPYQLDNLEFQHLIDELRNATNPQSGLPQNLQVDPKKLDRISVPQAVELVDKINKWRVENAGKLRLEETLKADLYKAYPEQKYRWVQLNRPGQFAAESDAMGHSVRGYEPPDRGGSDYYGVGGYNAIESGEAKIYSLRDEKGQPHVTIEVQSYPYAPRWEVVKGYLPQAEEMLRARGITNADEQEISEFATQLAKEKMPPLIKQIKGKGNAMPAEKYMPFIQDFVRSGNWSEVKDLRNAGLTRVGNEYLTSKEIKPLVEQSMRYLEQSPALEPHRQAERALNDYWNTSSSVHSSRYRELENQAGMQVHPDIPYTLGEIRGIFRDPGAFGENSLGENIERVNRLRQLYGEEGFKKGGPVDVPRETSTSKQQLDKLAQVSQRKKA